MRGKGRRRRPTYGAVEATKDTHKCTQSCLNSKLALNMFSSLFFLSFSSSFTSICTSVGYHSGQITCEINSSSPLSRKIACIQPHFCSADRAFGLNRSGAAAVHFLSKRRVVLLHSESMASSSNSHNPLLWDQVSEHRPCAIETGGGGAKGGGGASIFLISIFHPVPLFLSLSLLPSNHKSLLGAITALVLQWMGGRIDPRVEDERREAEKRCCKKITVAYAHRKHIDC